MCLGLGIIVHRELTLDVDLINRREYLRAMDTKDEESFSIFLFEVCIDDWYTAFGLGCDSHSAVMAKTLSTFEQTSKNSILILSSRDLSWIDRYTHRSDSTLYCKSWYVR